MDCTERFHKILELLNRGRPVPRQVFLDELEVSAATFNRNLEHMRDRMNAPIVYSSGAGGKPGGLKTLGPGLRRGDEMRMSAGATRRRPVFGVLGDGLLVIDYVQSGWTK